MPALTPRAGESLASVAPETLDDTASSVATSPSSRRREKKEYGFGKRFAYQKLRGWRPILSAHNAEVFFLTVGTLLLALGIPILVAAMDVKEFSVRYDDAGPMANLTDQQRQEEIWEAGKEDDAVVYSLSLTVTERMDPPIYVVFELGRFRQNYRRYVRSFDPSQMHDGSSTPGITACSPFRYEGDNESRPILPCGQISQSNFNDTYELSVGGQPLRIDDSNIAWDSDRDYLYGDVLSENFNLIPNFRGGNTTSQPLDQSQHWMVWQRPGGAVPLQKLFGRIDDPIEAGTQVNVTVFNRYNTYAFGGSKRLILTTNTWVGDRNFVLPIVYLVVAGLCYLTALAFFLGYDLGLIWKREAGVEDDFSWVRNPPTH